MVAGKNKKAKMEEESVEQINGELFLSIEKLQAIQDDLDKGLANGVNHDDMNGNKRALPEQSFFTWFTDAQYKEDVGDGIYDDEVAYIIKEDLWDNPLTYFNKDTDEEDSYDDDDDDEEDDEEDEDEE